MLATSPFLSLAVHTGNRWGIVFAGLPQESNDSDGKNLLQAIACDTQQMFNLLIIM